MCFGLITCEVIFQRKNDQIYKNCQGVVGITYDVEVLGDDSTHDLHVHEALGQTHNSRCQIKFW